VSIHDLTICIVSAPLLGAVLAGFFGKPLGRRGSHVVTIGLVLASFVLSCLVAKAVWLQGVTSDTNLYTWVLSGSFQFNIGFYIDQLTALMLLIVTFVSLLVHIYSIGYMQGDPGYQRFFAYISLFTFAMLMLVTANNMFQLFFGWESVGLVSYLLIGFWFKRESAIQGSLKAFIVNRVGDFGFILGIAAVLDSIGSIDYATVFARAPEFAHTTLSILPGHEWSLMSVIAILLFIGAMGKSAQIPLHIWLPESMEGPTPISALIHAATMVTAGIFMVTRMSPIYELSPTALSLITIVGASGALFLGLVGVVQHDIKRVVAYSTLSQLGYMTAALGVSAFSAGIFHLATHACFKALLFLGAGSVIIAMHHDQDLRHMGGLRKYMPITCFTFLIGALSLAAIPPFAGFYSKDAIIEAIQISQIPGAGYAYVCVLLGAFVTALYIFRAYFLAFHGSERMQAHTKEHLKESPKVVTLPLMILAVPSIVLGAILVGPMLYQKPSLLGNAVKVLPQYDVLGILAHHFQGALNAALGAVKTLPFWFAIAGIMTAWYTCLYRPGSRQKIIQILGPIYPILKHQYGFDQLNDLVFIRGSKCFARFLHRVGDVKIIDDSFVNGSGRLVAWISNTTRHLQSGYLYHYTLAMIIGLVGFLVWLVMG